MLQIESRVLDNIIDIDTVYLRKSYSFLVSLFLFFILIFLWVY